MPLVRIITHSVEAANPLIKQLKARGYTVETRLPGESRDKPADLEIVLEKVKPEEALARATNLARTTDSNVYIGAGTFRSHRVDVPAPQHHHTPGYLPVPSVEDTVNGVAAGLQNKRDLLAKAIWEQRANMREARRLQRERVRHEQARVAADAERLRVEEEERTRVVAAAEAEQQRISAGEAERQRMAEIVASEQAERAERERVERLERERAEQVERESIAAQQAEAERQAERVAQQLAIEASSSVEQEHAELPLEQPQLAEISPVPRQESLRANDSSHRPRARSAPPKLGRARSTHSRAREWRAAVIVSSIFALLLMLAWRVVTRGPFSPLPTAVTNQPNLQQELPFGGVTLSPAGSDISESLAPAARPAGKVIRPIPADLHSSTRPSPEPENPSGSAGQHVAVQRSKASAAQASGKKRSTSRRSKPRRDTEDEIAEDEVIIRHFTPKPAATPSSAQKASLKRYSDLDQ